MNSKLIIREGARRVDTCPPCHHNCRQSRECPAYQDGSEDAPPYTPEVVMSWPELGLTLLVAAISAAMLVWFLAANWPRLVVWLSF